MRINRFAFGALLLASVLLLNLRPGEGESVRAAVKIGWRLYGKKVISYRGTDEAPDCSGALITG